MKRILFFLVLLSTLVSADSFDPSGVGSTILGMSQESFIAIVGLLFITGTILVLGGIGYGALGILVAAAETDFLVFVFPWFGLPPSLTLLINIVAVLSWMRRGR